MGAEVLVPVTSVPAWAHEQLAIHRRAASSLVELLPSVIQVAELLCATFARGGVLYTFGNGGSAADAQHLTGELIGHYKRDRRPLAAVTLTGDAAVMTCIANDYSFADVFTRQVQALVRPGDVVAAFSTSGRSANVVTALAAARDRGATTVLFSGASGGLAAQHADICLAAPATQTARIQEMHTLMLHLISEHVDAWAAGEQPVA